MSLPRLSNLQILVLGALLHGELRGQDLRTRLKEFGAKKSGPSFYQLMARLEDTTFVSGHYVQEIVDGQIIRERVYRIEGAGRKAWATNREFQLSVIQRFDAKKGTSRA